MLDKTYLFRADEDISAMIEIERLRMEKLIGAPVKNSAAIRSLITQGAYTPKGELEDDDE